MVKIITEHSGTGEADRDCFDVVGKHFSDTSSFKNVVYTNCASREQISKYIRYSVKKIYVTKNLTKNSNLRWKGWGVVLVFPL